MAITITTQDINNYPGTTKPVYVDVQSVVPTEEMGDEKYMIKTYTNAYSDNTVRTNIADIYITKPLMGWSKSSGLNGSVTFPLTSSANKIDIKLDATVSGTTGTGFYTISLDYSLGGVALPGEVVAEDLQNKLRSIQCTGSDVPYQLAYKNSVVSFTNGRFKIVSGTIATSFSGPNRSSVKVQASSNNDCSVLLGFNHQTTSEQLDSIAVGEALITADYTADSNTLSIDSGSGLSTGDAFYITDGVNSDYCIALDVTESIVTVATNAANNFTGISHNYTTAAESYIQALKVQDRDNKPHSYLEDVDSIVRAGVRNLINQIDYSE